MRFFHPSIRTALLLLSGRAPRLATHTCAAMRCSMEISSYIRYSAHVLAEPGQRTARVTVLLSREEFERLDAYCVRFGHKKSTLTARLIRDFLNQQELKAGDETE